MNTLATVVNLIGRAWAVTADGERREIQLGDRLRGDEMLITEPGARVDLDFGNNQQLTFLGEQQQTLADVVESAQAIPAAPPRPATEEREQPQQTRPSQEGGEPEGHNFVQLVRIQEIIEADGITPLTVARIQEVLRPLGMFLPERGFEPDEWREHRGGEERHHRGSIDNVPPSLVQPLPPQSDEDGGLVDLDLGGYFTDKSPNLTYKVEGLPPGLSYDPSTGKITGTIDKSGSQGGPGGDGNYPITVTVTDPVGNSTTSTFPWAVSNPPPIATDDSQTIEEDTVATGNLITGQNSSGTGGGADNDPDGDELTVIGFTVGGNSYQPGETATITGVGTITVEENGDYIFTPEQDWHGSVPDIGYTISDGEGGTDESKLTITVTPVNDAPVPINTIDPQANEDAELIEVTLDLPNLFTDVDGDELSYSITGLPEGLEFDPLTGKITGTIDNSASQGGPNEDGEHQVTVTATDPSGETATQTFTWKVRNPAPEAENDAGTTLKSTRLTVSAKDGVLQNDTDPDNDELFVQGVVGGSDAAETTAGVGIAIKGEYGTLVLQEDGSYVYTPDLTNDTVWVLPKGEQLVDEFTYTVSDGEGGTDTAVLSITINGHSNTPPFLTPKDHNDEGAVAIGGHITVYEKGLQKGSEPGEGQLAEGLIQISALDGLQSISVAGEVFDLATLQALTNGEVGPIVINNVNGGTLTLNGFDPLIVTKLGVDLVLGGDIHYTYELGADQQHADGNANNSLLLNIQLGVLDDQNASSIDSDNLLVVNVVDDVPTAVDDSNSITEDDVPAVTGDVRSNDTQGADGATITRIVNNAKNTDKGTADAGTDGVIEIEGKFGTLKINVDGTYTYVLDNENEEVNALKDGDTETDVFTYTLTDADGDSSSAKLTITIHGHTDAPPTIEAVDHTPGVDGHVTVHESGLSHGSDAGADSESAAGSIAITAADGLLSITIAEETFSLTDLADLATTPVSLTVAGGTLQLTGFTADTLVGSVPITGTLSYIYTLDADRAHRGAEHETLLLDIPLSVADAGGATADGTLTVQVVDDEPLLEADLATVIEGSIQTGNVLSNDLAGADGWHELGAVIGVAPTATGVTGSGGVGGRIDGKYGYLILNADGSYQYVSTANAVLKDEVDIFTYTVRDGDGDLAHTTLTINVTNVSLPPAPITEEVEESGLTGGTNEGSGHTVTGKVTLPPGVTEVVPQTNVPTEHGTFTIDKYGEYTYTLTENTSGNNTTDTFTYTSKDPSGNTVENTVTINIVDDAPVAVADTNSITEDAASNQVHGNVLGGRGVSAGDKADSLGADGATITGIQPGTVLVDEHVPNGGLSTIIQGKYGTLILHEGGNYTYTLNNNHPAVNALKDGSVPLEDVFTYTITDGDGDQSTTTLTIDIEGNTDGTPSIVPDDVNGPDDPSNITSMGHTTVHERGLSSTDDSHINTGSITIRTPDGLGSILVGNKPVDLETLLKLNPSDPITHVEIITDEGKLTLTGFDISTEVGGVPTLGELQFTYELVNVQNTPANPDDPEVGRNSQETIDLLVIDAGGSSAPGELIINIIDDTPVARDDVNQIDEDTSSVGGNVIADGSTGDVEDTPGADDATLTDIVSNNISSTATTDGDGNLVIQGEFGTLTISSDGEYNYRLNNSNLEVQGLSDNQTLEESFTYTLTDGDGDQATAQLTITINGTNDGVTVTVPDLNDPDYYPTVDPDDPDDPALTDITDLVVFESGLSTGSRSSGTAVEALVKVDSSFTLLALDGLANSNAVTFTYTGINGESRTLSLSKEQVEALETDNQTIDTQYGKLVLNDYSQDADGIITLDYEYTLQRAPQVNGDDTNDRIRITARDSDINNDAKDLVIRIIDDAPEAQNDANAITEDAPNNTVIGNVIGGTGVSDDDVADTVGADDASVTAIVSNHALTTPATTNSSGDLVIEGQYGTLTIRPDGFYTYELDNSNPLVNALKTGQSLNDEIFTYTITDGDGDPANATLTITINGNTDGAPGLVIEDHNGLEVGHNSIAENAFTPVVGHFVISAPDGLKEIQVGATTVSAEALADLADNKVPITGSEGTLTLTGYDPTTGQVSYSYQQTGTSKDHSAGDDKVTDRFPITVTDLAGESTAPSDLVILITDTAPEANPDTGTIKEDAADPLIGNVLTGDAGNPDDLADTLGADITTVVGVTPGTDTKEQAGGIGGTGINGAYGTLVLNSGGDYSYTLDANNSTVNALKDGDTLTDTFSYTIKDADGDWSTTTLTITIEGKTDGAPSIVPDDKNGAIDGHITVHESGLTGGSSAGSDDNTANGTMQINAGDGLDSISIGNTSFTLAQLQALSAASPSDPITVEGGTLVLTGFTPVTSVGGVPTSGTLEYTYTLTGERTHSAQGNDDVLLDIPLSVTDAGNKTIDGTLVIQVVDDVPTAVADTDKVTEGGTVSGEVLGNDKAGADGWHHLGEVVGVVAGDAGATSIGGIGGRIEGTYGYLILNADGEYTYVSTANAVTGDEVDIFTYTVRDGDGDLAHTTLTINVTNVSLTSAPITEEVEESGLTGGTTAGSGHTVTGNVTLPSGVTEIVPQTNVPTEHGIFTIDEYGTYTYTLTETTSGDNTTDTFTYISKDPNGNTVENTVTINIVDDEPKAVDDVNSIPAGSYVPVTGELINGGLGGAGKDSEGADGATVTSVVNTLADGTLVGDPVTVPKDDSTTTIDGQYGVLTIEADGSYSYQRNPGTPGNVKDIFTYTLTDADEDYDTATLTIDIGDATPTISDLNPKVNGGELVFDEKHLIDGSAPNNSQLTKAGDFIIHSPDGIGSLAVGGLTVITNNVFTAGTVTTPLGHVLKITSYEPDTGLVSYEYTLTSRENHDQNTNDTELFDDITITLTDLDNDGATGILSVKIIDDVPKANPDTGTISEDAAALLVGNVRTNDKQGADTATVTAIVSDNDSNSTATTNTEGNLEIEGEFGTLTISPDGSYTYALDNDNAEVNALKTGQTLAEKFTYTLTDTDEDSDTAALTITIAGYTDGTPSITPEDSNGADPNDFLTEGHATVHESGLTEDAPADESRVATGTLELEALDGIASVTIGNIELSVAQLATLATSNVVYVTPYGRLILTGYSSDTAVGGVSTKGTLSYRYELDRPVDNDTTPDATHDNFIDSIPVAIKDAGDASHSGSLDINIIDDAPSATNDSATVAAGTFELTQNDNVLDNDRVGADTARVTEVRFGNARTESVGDDNTNVTIRGEYGELTIRADGNYSYIRDPGTPGGVEDKFSYTLTDGDTDFANADLIITIDNFEPVLDIPAAGDAGTTVYESGLTHGTEEGTGKHITAGTIGFTSKDGLNSSEPVKLGGTAIGTNPTDLGNGLEAYYTYDASTGEGEIHYTYTLQGPTNKGSVNDVSFSVTVNDSDGQSASGNLKIDIINDAPIPNLDTNSVTEGDILVVDADNGVLSNDKAGADGWHADGAVVAVASNNMPGNDSSTHVDGLQIEGEFGTLILSPNGSYTYTSNPDAVETAEQDIFTYTVRDADGDERETTLTINIIDVTGKPTDTLGEVKEAGIVEDGSQPAGTAAGNGSRALENVSLELETGWKVLNEPGNLIGSTDYGNWTIDPVDGTYTYTLLKATEDIDGQNEFDRFTYKVVDEYGNTAVNTVTVVIVDDVPQVIHDAMKLKTLEVDETELQSGAPVTAFDDNFATGVFTANYGADGPAASDSLVYSLTVASAGVESGVVDTVTGQAVYLYLENDVVVGRVGNAGNADASGDVAFRVEIDGAKVTLTQSRALRHPIKGESEDAHDDPVSLTPGAISLVATVTDGDGDEASTNVAIGAQLIFLDDGPSITAPVPEEVDEKYLPSGSEASTAGGSELTVTNDLGVSFGADKGGIADATFTQATIDALAGLGLTTGGTLDTALQYIIADDGHTLTASDGTDSVFIVTITNPATNPGYSFTLSKALYHGPEEKIDLSFPFTVVDGDGDTASSAFVISIVDDAPSTDPRTIRVDEDSEVSFNVSSDANPTNTVINKPSAVDDSEWIVVTNGDGSKTYSYDADYSGAQDFYGSITVNDDGSITYKPSVHYSNGLKDGGFNADSFSYTLTEDDGTETTVQVSVNVVPVADAPKLEDDKEVGTLEDVPVNLQLVLPIIVDDEDENGSAADSGDNPERLGAITLKLIDAPDGTILSTDSTDLIPDTAGNIRVVISQDGSTPDPALHIAGSDIPPDTEPGVYYLMEAEYRAIHANPAEDRHENFKVEISVTSYEVDDDQIPLGYVDGKPNTQTVDVLVQAVTDEVELEFDTTKITGVEGVVKNISYPSDKQAKVFINEDIPFNLAQILAASFEDLDGTEERWITIRNPAGNDPILVNGTEVKADGSITIQAPTLSKGTSNIPAISIGGLNNFSGDLTGITVTLHARDRDDDGYRDADGVIVSGTPDDPAEGAEKTDFVTLDLHVNPAGGDASIIAPDAIPEDSPVAFLGKISVTDRSIAEGGTDNSIELIREVRFRVPSEWTVSQDTETGAISWTHATQGSWRMTDRPPVGDWSIAIVDGEVVIKATDTVDAANPVDALNLQDILSQFEITPPAHSSRDLELQVQVGTVDVNTVDGTAVASEVGYTTGWTDMKVEVTPVAEVVAKPGDPGYDTDGSGISDLTINPDHDYRKPGKEDEWFDLHTDPEVEGEHLEFKLAASWRNEDGNEKTFALLTPELKEGDGSLTDAKGSMFQYHDGTEWIVEIYNGEDPVEVPMEYLDTLQFKAAPDFSGMFSIKVQAKTVDYDDDDPSRSHTEISGSATLTNILILPVIDTLTATVTARVEGDEDERMPLSIRPKSSDLSEIFKVDIDGMPFGATLWYGSHTITAESVDDPDLIAAGITVTVSPADGEGNIFWSVSFEDFKPNLGEKMGIQAPQDSNDEFDLKVTIRSVDELVIPNEDTPDEPTVYKVESDPQTLDIKVAPKGIADPAEIVLIDYAVTGDFNEADVDANGIMLNKLITTAELKDTDGSEVLTFKISGLPADFSIQGAQFMGGTGPGREWSLTKDQLATAKLIVPPNFNGIQTFDLASVTTENDGDSLTEHHTVEVQVSPSPEATINLAASLDEDVSKNLSFDIVHQNNDEDEVLDAVWINADSLENNQLTLTYGLDGPALATGQEGVVLEDGWYKLTGSAITNIYAKGAENWHGSADFTVRYVIRDPGNDGLADVSKESVDSTYQVIVNPITDQVTLDTLADISMTDPGTANITPNVGNEGSDYDGSEQLTRIILENVPDGVVVLNPNSHFIGGGTWVIVSGDSDNHFITDPLTPEIKLQVHSHAGGLNNHAISITVVTEDADNGQETRASQTVNLSTDFTGGEAEKPAEILTWKQKDFDPTEDTGFTLDEAIEAEIDDSVVSNGDFTITLSNLPEGTVVTGMTSTTVGGQVVWSASDSGDNDALQNLLDSIIVTPPQDWNRNDGPFEYEATLTTHVPSGGRSWEDLTVTQQVIPVTDDAVISIDMLAVNEGNDLEITISITNPADNPNWTLEEGKLYLKLNEGVGMENGTLKPGGEAITATEIIDGVEYLVISDVQAAEDIKLTYTPVTEYVSGDITLDARVVGQENGAATPKTTTVSQTGTINPVNSGYDFSVADATGDEPAHAGKKDEAIQLNITDGGLNDEDGSESVTAILLKNLPNGFLVFVGNTADDAELVTDMADNAGGDALTNTWLLKPNDKGELPDYIAILPPKNWSGTVSGLELVVISGEASLSTSHTADDSFSLTVLPVANGLTIDPTPSFGEEGEIVGLNLNAHFEDLRKAGDSDQAIEKATIELQGLGAHAAFYLGEGTEAELIMDRVEYDEDNDVYTITGLTQDETDQLGFVQAASAIGDLKVRARTDEYDEDTGEEVEGVAPSDWTDASTITTTISNQFATSGDDELLWTGGAINGRGGDDTIQLRFGESLDGDTLATKLSNIEVIDMSGEASGKNEITGLSVEDVFNMTDGNNLLKILADEEDLVSLESGWGSGVTTGDSTVYTAIHTSMDGVFEVKLEVQTLIE